MKIIAIFFLAITVAFSQNVEPTQRTFNYKDINGNDVNNGLLDGSLDYFKINNFTLGFHWGGQRKISHALKFKYSIFIIINLEYILMSKEKFLLSFYYVDSEICKINNY